MRCWLCNGQFQTNLSQLEFKPQGGSINLSQLVKGWGLISRFYGSIWGSFQLVSSRVVLPYRSLLHDCTQFIHLHSKLRSVAYTYLAPSSMLTETLSP